MSTLIEYIDKFLTSITLTVRKIRNCIGIKKKEHIKVDDELHDTKQSNTYTHFDTVKF
jgi:hypothetical protein